MCYNMGMHNKKVQKDEKIGNVVLKQVEEFFKDEKRYLEI